MNGETKKRARALAGSLKAMAARVNDGSLVPGIHAVTDSTGAPVCAFGHALVDACRDVGVAPPVLGHSNTYELERFLNGDYAQSVSPDTRQFIRWDAARIADWNDRTFSDQPTSRSLVTYYMLALAEKLDVLMKEEERDGQEEK